MDKAGRKAGIFMHHMFGISGGAFALAAFFFNSPVCLMVSRFLFGVQGGMSCTLVPTYLAEISPAALRGRTGVIHQLCITIGIVIAQLFGLRQILGSQDLWGYLIAVPLIPALFGSITLLLFLPESPRALISKNRDEETVKKCNFFIIYKLVVVKIKGFK
jgi:MFS family permease